LGDGKIESDQNWKGRFKDNSDRMRTGSIYDVVEVLKSLSHLARSKSLSFREKRMLDRAKFLVVSEISEVMGQKSPAIDERVEQMLERCFVTKAKNTARTAAAKATRAKTAEAAEAAEAAEIAAAAAPVVAASRPSPAAAARTPAAPRRAARAS